MNLNQKISELKAEGRSLREIGRVLGISQVAVFKRLKRLNGEEKVLTKTENARLTASSRKNDEVLTSSKPRKSRVSEESGTTVNHVVTKKTPSMETNGSVTPSQDAVGGRLEGIQGASDAVCGSNSEVVTISFYLSEQLWRRRG